MFPLHMVRRNTTTFPGAETAVAAVAAAAGAVDGLDPGCYWCSIVHVEPPACMVSTWLFSWCGERRSRDRRRRSPSSSEEDRKKRKKEKKTKKMRHDGMGQRSGFTEASECHSCE